MAVFELKLPQMGESIAEATITSWLKKVGDPVALDEAIVEVATDKVDSEIPSEVTGVLSKILFQQDSVVKVGQTIALIETQAVATNGLSKHNSSTVAAIPAVIAAEKIIEQGEAIIATTKQAKFYSPLVKKIAKTEGISKEQLHSIKGTGKEGRVTKNDILLYIEHNENATKASIKTAGKSETSSLSTSLMAGSTADEVIEMSRMGKLISKHMTASLQTSAHVQSFIEIDVTHIVKWRTEIKDAFFEKEGEKLTFTPIFMQAVATTIKKYPLINISIQDDKIIKKKAINLGMATALPDGNLVVPVIKNADRLNLIGMTKAVNDLAKRARTNQLQPDEVQAGTYTVTNVGSFGSIMGTPIINQPQVAILALGAIRKLPAVIETPQGDCIGIRQKMMVSHSYDHRVVNGALGGLFIKTLKEILESWKPNF